MTRLFNPAAAGVDRAELERRAELLSHSTVFQAVPANELQLLAAMFEPVSFATGQVICREGEEATHVYAIVVGTIEVQRGGAVVRTINPGEIVGEYGLLGYGLRTATLVARDEVQALQIDYQRFSRFLLAFPDATLSLLRVTVDQLLLRGGSAT